MCFARPSRIFLSCGFPALLSPSAAVVGSVAVVVVFVCSSCGLIHWVACRSLDRPARWVQEALWGACEVDWSSGGLVCLCIFGGTRCGQSQCTGWSWHEWRHRLQFGWRLRGFQGGLSLWGAGLLTARPGICCSPCSWQRGLHCSWRISDYLGDSEFC